jgi:ABC-type glycerol-3-phosphate transport system substrate-binding protein
VSGGLAPVGLEFWLPGRQADADALTPFHQQFVAETPAVSGVTVQLVPNETMMERLTASLAAGTPPDIARLKEYRLADIGARDALLPLDALLAKDPGLRLTDFFPQSLESGRVVAPVPPGPSQTAPGPRDRRVLLGLPDSQQLVGLYWNQDLVARAGLDPTQPPATWEALRQGARAIAGAGDGAGDAVDPGASGGSAPASSGGSGDGPGRRWGFQFYEFSTREQTYCWFMEWIWRAGGEVWADQGRDRTRATLDTPEALRALQWQVDLLHADRTAVPAGTPVPELIANVSLGRVGYWMTTANAALTYGQTAPGLRFGLGPLPPDRRDAHQLQHNALSVFRASAHPDAAYRLLAFRAGEDVQARWAVDGGWLPVRPALWSRPPFSQDERWRAIGALVRRPGNRTKPVVPEWEPFTATVLPPLLAAWSGESGARAALVAAERAANASFALRAG